MSMPANVTPFDPRPLLEPVDRSAAQAFTRQLRAEGRLPGTVASNVIAIVVLGSGVYLWVQKRNVSVEARLGLLQAEAAK